MSRIGRYMEPEGGEMSWYSTMRNIKRQSDQDFRDKAGGTSFVNKIKGLFAKAQGAPPQSPNKYDNIQRPGLLGDLGQASFFRKVQNMFLKKKDNVHAVARHHYARHPEEGASRPGFIKSPIQGDRPGFIAGYGTASAGAEILEESKKTLTRMSLVTAIAAIGLFLYFRNL